VMIGTEGTGDALVGCDDVTDAAIDGAIQRAKPEGAGADWRSEDRGGKRGSGTGKGFDHWKGPFAKILAPLLTVEVGGAFRRKLGVNMAKVNALSSSVNAQ